MSQFKGVPYGTDASQLAPAGIPCVVLGPGSIDQAHTIDEYVELEEVEKAVEIYRRIMLEY
jgi:acetylornithine deacetylase/succinyl-diaminopimelate desuccinylase-like protein